MQNLTDRLKTLDFTPQKGEFTVCEIYLNKTNTRERED